MGIFSRSKQDRTPPLQDRVARAKALNEQGQKEAALQALNEEIAENPGNGTAYSYRASIYNRLQRYDESVADYTRALEIDPRNAMTYYYRGNSYHMGGKSWEALADMKHSLALDLSNQRARENLRFLELYIEEKKIPRPQPTAHKRPADASRSSEEDTSPASSSPAEFLAALTPDERTAVSNLDPMVYEAVLAAKAGGYTGVNFVSLGSSGPSAETGPLLSKLDRADVQRLAESVNYTIRADAAAQTDIEEAARLYRKAFELNPYDDVAIMSYAATFVRQGKIREALPWAERAAQVNPKSERTRRNLEKMRSWL